MIFKDPNASLESQFGRLKSAIENCERKPKQQEIIDDIDSIIIPRLNYLGFSYDEATIGEYIKKALAIRKDIGNFLMVSI